jgi:CRISPR-associated protein Cas1
VRVDGRQSTLRTVLQKQARHLAVFLRGDSGAYCPYVASW